MFHVAHDVHHLAFHRQKLDVDVLPQGIGIGKRLAGKFSVDRVGRGEPGRCKA